MAKTKKKRKDIVYSTAEDFEYEFENVYENETLPIEKQNLKVLIDSKSRKGKSVVVIQGFLGKEEDLKGLSKILKYKIGVGGTAKNDEIIIQTNDREQVCGILANLGYKFKKSGG